MLASHGFSRISTDKTTKIRVIREIRGSILDWLSRVRDWPPHDKGETCAIIALAGPRGAGARFDVASRDSRRLLLFFRQERRHSSAGTKSLYHLGPRSQDRNLHGA